VERTATATTKSTSTCLYSCHQLPRPSCLPCILLPIMRMEMEKRIELSLRLRPTTIRQEQEEQEPTTTTRTMTCRMIKRPYPPLVVDCCLRPCNKLNLMEMETTWTTFMENPRCRKTCTENPRCLVENPQCRINSIIKMFWIEPSCQIMRQRQ
jgi:hypothetical protein